MTGWVPEGDHFTFKYVHHHKENVSVYTCFVDYRKAFDSVGQEGFFYKLLKTIIIATLVS